MINIWDGPTVAKIDWSIRGLIMMLLDDGKDVTGARLRIAFQRGIIVNKIVLSGWQKHETDLCIFQGRMLNYGMK